VFGTLEWVRFSVRFFWIFWVPVRFWVLRFRFGFGSGSQIFENPGSGFGSRFQLIKKNSLKYFTKWILLAKFLPFSPKLSLPKTTFCRIWSFIINIDLLMPKQSLDLLKILLRALWMDKKFLKNNHKPYKWYRTMDWAGKISTVVP
jgi:hypothetical protein